MKVKGTYFYFNCQVSLKIIITYMSIQFSEVFFSKILIFYNEQILINSIFFLRIYFIQYNRFHRKNSMHQMVKKIITDYFNRSQIEV